LHPGHRLSTGLGADQAIADPPNDAPQRPQNFVPAGCSMPQRVQRILPGEIPTPGWFKLGEPDDGGWPPGIDGGGLPGSAEPSEVTG